MVFGEEVLLALIELFLKKKKVAAREKKKKGTLNFLGALNQILPL